MRDVCVGAQCGKTCSFITLLIAGALSIEKGPTREKHTRFWLPNLYDDFLEKDISDAQDTRKTDRNAKGSKLAGHPVL